jgi:endonuclease/exonuclease/phosphatase family metal-dependent hydrolase
MAVAWRFFLCLWAALAFPLVCPAESGHSIFCAYNVENWLEMERFDGVSTRVVSNKPEPEKARVIQMLAAIKPDILGLSEIGTVEDVEDIRQRLLAAGIDLPHSEMAEGEDRTRRLALLSRHPIASRDSKSDLGFQLNGKPFRIQRGLLDCAIELPGHDQPVRFLGVHLKSKRKIPVHDEAEIRRFEAELIREQLDGYLEQDPKAKIVLYGDFNEHRNEPPIKALQGSRTGQAYMEPVHLADHNGQVWTHFWEAAHVYSRLDYVFVSRSMKPFVLAEKSHIYHVPDFKSASDHRPLVVFLAHGPADPAKP